MTVACQCDVLTELDGLEAEEYAQSHLIARSDESQFRAPLTAILWCPLIRGHHWFMEAGHDDQPSHLYWDNGWFRELSVRFGLSLDEYEGETIPALRLPAFVDLLDRLVAESEVSTRVRNEAQTVSALLRKISSGGADAWFEL